MAESSAYNIESFQGSTQISELESWWKGHANFHYLTPKDREWFSLETRRLDLDIEEKRKKLSFYLDAAKLRVEIIELAPQTKKGEILNRLNKLLNGSESREIKRERLNAALTTLKKLKRNQELVKSSVQRIRNLPAGLEQKIWDRFMKRFEKETSGDLLNPDLMENFHRSIETTFRHLARVLDMQAELEKRIGKEKYFRLKSESGPSIRDTMSQILSIRLEEWLSQKISLKDWSRNFEELIHKQTPQNLKEFNEHYSQVFDPKFWRLLPKMQPMFFPNFTRGFNFQTEEDFLTKFTLNQIKKFPETLKTAAEKDLKETLQNFFTPKEVNEWSQKLRNANSKRPAEVLNILLEAQFGKDQRQTEALNIATHARKLLIAKNIRGAANQLEMLEKKFGLNTLQALRLTSLKTSILTQITEVKRLELRIKSTTDKKEKTKYQTQLAKISDDTSLLIDYEDPKALDAEIARVVNEINYFKNQSNFGAARNAINQLYALDAVKAYAHEKSIKNLEGNETEDEDDKKEKITAADKNLDMSSEKQQKLNFYNGCIEHAKKVMEECTKLGIPVDDSKFWGSPDGVRNRVKWLKETGLYTKYAAFNSSDPNVPKEAQTGGFRFRWLDGVGSASLTGGKAASGVKYLARYKESGYALCALAGAFSINWQGPSSETYTPKQFIEKIQSEIGKL